MTAPDRPGTSPGLSPAPLPERLSWRLLVSGGLAFLLIGLLPGLYAVALPVWSDRFALAEGRSSTLLAAQGAGAFVAVAAGITGVPVLTLRIGLGLLAAGAAVLAGGWGWGMTLAGAFVAGLGHGMVSVAVNRRVLTESGARGAGLIGVVNAAFGLGAIAAPLLFLAAGARPGPVFWALAGAAALLALGAAPERAGPPGPRGLPPRHPRLLLLLFNVVAVAIEVMLSSLGASALIDLGLGEAEAARLTSGFFAAFFLGRLALWWLARVMGPQALVLLGLAGTGACATAAALGATPLGGALGLAGPAYMLSGAFVGIAFPSFYVWGSHVLGRDPRMSSAIVTSGLVGATLGPLLMQPILGATGDAGVFGVMGGLGLGTAAAFALVVRRGGA